MRTIFRLRSVALVATIAMMGATAFVASGATGAYFSDTNSGEVTGSLGSIQVDTSGGDGTDSMDFTLTGLLPGVPRSVTVSYTNAGVSPQDIYISIPDSDDIDALNGFGSWASVVIRRGNHDWLWGNGGSTVWPTSGALLVRSNVAPGATGSVVATFTIDSSIEEPNVTGTPTSVTVGYDILATQVGILPGA